MFLLIESCLQVIQVGGGGLKELKTMKPFFPKKCIEFQGQWGCRIGATYIISIFLYHLVWISPLSFPRDLSLDPLKLRLPKFPAKITPPHNPLVLGFLLSAEVVVQALIVSSTLILFF